MNTADAYKIFTPNGLPTLTYVRRQLTDEAGNKYSPEDRLRKELRIPGRVVSISGPSKSGKTALVETVVGIDRIIKISGAQVTDEEKLWDLVLEQLKLPKETKSTSKVSHKDTAKLEIKAEAGVPVGFKASTGIGTEQTDEQAEEQSTTYSSDYQKAVSAIKEKGMILFLDDFHYMPEGMQKTISEVIKHVAEHDKIHICVAQVRHKSDLVIRKNPDLTGRLANIDFDLWSTEEIKEIAHGFRLLNAAVSDSVLTAFAGEAGGSPQIMQSICLSACEEYEIIERQEKEFTFHANNIDTAKIISSCIRGIDRGRLAGRLEEGPPTHGTERLKFNLINGTQLDVYGCIMAAIALNPPWLEITKAQLIDRIGFIIKGPSPTTTSIINSIGQMQTIASKFDNSNDYLEWDPDKGLQIIDPYLLFYIRWVAKFREIRDAYEAKKRTH